ncbi:Na+/H+ antiporter subunit E [Frankia sp. CcI49]|uniref:Na+/H+ antiporter subunit E n=1 Tax=Frankia sp. CcI49 TaxID=1745382 RepID=UPI000A064BEC|nr:Na+/H+ antiporter subunit E [Frankia sp. CcI49]
MTATPAGRQTESEPLVERPGSRAALRQMLRRPGRLVWLWVVWAALWGRLTPLVMISGLVVAAGVLVLFPLRDADAPVRFRLLPSFALVGWLLADLVPASLSVAAQMIRNGPRTRSAIVEVPLAASSEIISTLTANAISLAPGAFVLEIDHQRGALYVHMLAVEDDRMADRVRDSVRSMHHRVLKAFGLAEDVRRPTGARARPPGKG